MGRSWLDEDNLILVLDDLDEIPSRYLPDAIRAINAFRESHGLTGLIIASRMDVYQSTGVKLKLGGAVELQPLTPVQIDTYLGMDSPQMDELRATIRGDEALTKVAQSPLWLNVISVAYQDQPAIQDTQDVGDPNLTDSAIHRQRLIHAYIQHAFQRRTSGSKYDPQETTRILTWLAKNMDSHNQNIFQIDGLQPSWLPSGGLRWVFSLGRGLALGIVNAITVLLAVLAFSTSMPFDQAFMMNLFWIFLLDLPIGVLLGGLQGFLYERAKQQNKPAVSTSRQRWLRSVFLGLVSGAVFLAGLLLLGIEFGSALFISGWSGAFYTVGTQNIGITYRNAVETVESLTWSWKDAIRSLIPGMSIGIVFTFLTAFDDPDVFFYALAQWVSPWALAFFVTGGLQGRRVEEKTRPNQGIWLSVRNAAFVGGVTGLVLFAFFWLFHEPYGVKISFAIYQGLMTAFALAMTQGVGVVEHYLIRGLLYVGVRIPRDLAGFLDHAAGLVLLRKVGGGYIFIHRMLMRYFASREEVD